MINKATTPQRRRRRGGGVCCRIFCWRILVCCAVAHVVLVLIVLWQNEASLPYRSNHHHDVTLRAPQGGDEPTARVAVMPVVEYDEPWALYQKGSNDGNNNHSQPQRNNDWNQYSIRVADSVSGCEPKFLVHVNVNNKTGQEFLFKPSKRYRALYEWIAYHTSELLGLHRVPPVRPIALSRLQITQAITTAQQAAHASIWHRFKCRMKFQQEHVDWLPLDHHHHSGPHNNNNQHDIIVGTVQLLIPHVRQRAELDRAVNRQLLQGWWDRHHPVSAFVQRERDTRRLFDSLLGNVDRFNNDFVVEQRAKNTALGNVTSTTSQSQSLLLYLDNSLLVQSAKVEKPWYCRSYYHMVERLRALPDLTLALSQQMTTREPDSQALVQEWYRTQVVGRKRDLNPLDYVNDRRITVLAHVDACVKRFGFDHVFVQE